MLKIAEQYNKTLWFFAAIVIGFVLLQACLFLRLALKYNKKYKIVSKSELHEAYRTGMVSCIGPSCSSAIIALSLITIVGGATTFMRCGVLGAPKWELLMANTTAAAIGVEFDSAAVTPNIFVLCLFGMILGSAPEMLTSIIVYKPLDRAVEKAKKSKAELSVIPYISNAAMASLLCYMSFNNVNSIPTLTCWISAAVTSYIVSEISKKTKNSLLGSFNLAISMVVGMAVGQCVTILS